MGGEVLQAQMGHRIGRQLGRYGDVADAKTVDGEPAAGARRVGGMAQHVEQVPPAAPTTSRHLRAVHLELVEPANGRSEPRQPVADAQSADAGQLAAVLLQLQLFQREAVEEVARHPAHLQTIARVERGQRQEPPNDERRHRWELQQRHQHDDYPEQRRARDPEPAEPPAPRARRVLPWIADGFGHRARQGGRMQAPGATSPVKCVSGGKLGP